MFPLLSARRPPARANRAVRPVPLALPEDPGHPASVVTPTLFTVRLAGALVALADEFVTTHWNWSPVIADVVPSTTSIGVADPLYVPESERLAKVVDPLAMRCHW